MSNEVEIKLPKLGESIVGATVVQWLKQVGDRVTVDEALLEVSTDKVNSEIPSPVAGILKKTLVVTDQELEVGDPLAIIALHDAGQSEKVSTEPVRMQREPLLEDRSMASSFTPAVLRLAQVEGISMEVLQKISGTGAGGRISRKDVEAYLTRRKASPPVKVASAAIQGTERMVMTPMRKAIADSMVRSFYQAPHASLIAEIDVTNAMKRIAKEKESFLEAHGAKLTITSFMIQALAKAIEQFPMINASLENETIVLKRYVNVGIAVSVEKGILVPVLRDCQERSLSSIAKALGDLSLRARQAKLAPDEVKEGTITLTNFGMSGALIGIPIIHYPEVAIIGMGAVQKKVVVLEDDCLAIRQTMHVTLTFDHRVIDGMYGCGFLAALKETLEGVSPTPI